MLDIWHRLLGYVLLSFAGAVFIIYLAIRQTYVDLETDPSAGAWMGFLPFLVPFFWYEALKYVGIFAAVVEISILIYKYILCSS